MLFSSFRKPAAQLADPTPVAPLPDARRVVGTLAQQASTLGREAAEVRGVLDDSHKTATAQGAAVQALAQQVQHVLRSQTAIGEETELGLKAVAQVDQAVHVVGIEVAGIVETLHQVADAAGQITQIALQTRLVAFNASVEAKRAGEAGRGFGVVADAVKDLAGKVESSSKEIMGTVSQLDSRIAALSREITRQDSSKEQSGQGSGAVHPGGQPGAVHLALAAVTQSVHRILAASQQSREVCGGLDGQITTIDSEMRRTTTTLTSALNRTEVFLRVSENLIETVAECGIETEDTPYILAAQQTAGQITKLLEDAVRTGTISQQDLFDDQYRPISGSNPAQHTTRFIGVADRLFPQVQEKVLGLSEKVVFCIAADRNGYIACHNQKYNHAQRSGDVAWNTANCRNRRIFNDRTGLASARNQRPFLLQTYRRDMGGGNFIVMKEAAAPIAVGGRHWGGLRLAFKF